MTSGERFPEARPRRRRAGDPNLTDADREVFRRLMTGDLAEAFAASLAEAGADPLLSDAPEPDE